MLPQLIVFSGAGLSAESGLATFRGASGLWEGVPLEKVCTYSTWRENFDAVHDFYDARRRAVLAAKPNAAHLAIAGWQKRWPGRVHLLTQNVDRLLENAGCSSVAHLHGDVHLMHCVACDLEWEIEDAVYDHSGCPICHQKKSVKPAVVFFGQAAPNYALLHELAGNLGAADTAVVIGTSGAVLPADQLFGASKAYSILINLEPGSSMNEMTFTERHYGPATQLVPSLAKTLQDRMGIAR